MVSRKLFGGVAIGFLCLGAWTGLLPRNSGRRLLAAKVSDEALSDIGAWFDDPRQGFKTWMNNAGLAIADDEPLPSLKIKLIKRVLMMCFDVFPSSIMNHYSDDLAEMGDIGLRASRVLTQAEENIKDFFQNDASKSLRTTKKTNAPSYFGIIPDDMGRIIPGDNEKTYETRCWKQVSASIVEAKDGWNVQIKVAKAKDLVPFHCTDFYLLATASGLQLAALPTPVGGTKTYHFKTSKLSESEKWDLEKNGVRMLLFRDGPLTILQNLLDTALLFTSELTKGVGPLAARRNLDFLKRYAGVTMEERTDSGDLILEESDIHSGDFLGVIRFDGLDPMLAWAMGSHTGHTTVALWEDEQLYIAESTANGSYWPVNGIQRTPYRQWIDQARAAGFSVVHAPLAEEYREAFDVEAANAAFHNLDGIDYGYSTLLVGWLDTKSGNYPCVPPYDTANPACLIWTHLEVLLPIASKFIAAAEQIFLPAWNIRVTGDATSGLSATEIYQKASEKGIAYEDIFSIVESDSSLYPNTFNNGTKGMAPAMVCDVLVCNIWKAGGLFKGIDNEFNCGEQTNNDVYNLNILAPFKTRPEKCVTADPNNNLCQLVGKYEMTLPTVGTRAPYKHMQEHCPGKAPHYERSDDC